MSIVFFGSGEFAVPSLAAVAQQVSLVITQPDRPSGRGMRLQPSPVKRKAEELGLKVATPERCRAPEFAETLRAENPELLLVAAYGKILPMGVLEIGKRGGINLHGSILPKYRGAAPIQHAILSGERETGVTLMQMDKGMDTGDMIDIVKTRIGPDETYGELQERLAHLAADLIAVWLPKLLAGDYPRTPQNEAEATIAAKVEKEDARLDFERSASVEYSRFRAFTPNPGAYLATRFGRIRISQARLSDAISTQGTVLAPNLVAFKGGSLELIEVQPDGKRRMSGKDFFNGARLRAGDSLLSYAT